LRQPELVKQSGELDPTLDTVKRADTRDDNWHTRQQRRGGCEQPRLLMRREHHVDPTLGNHLFDGVEIADRIGAGRGHAWTLLIQRLNRAMQN
jgi:hypothetical protein